jgi:hypothetical protein
VRQGAPLNLVYSVPSASTFPPLASRQTPIYLRGSHLHCISAIQASSKLVNIDVPAGAPIWPFAYEAKKNGESVQACSGL